MGTLTIITQPTVEPVTLTEAKAALNVTHSNDDTRITALIQVAREFAEDYTNLKFVSQVIELSADTWPGNEFIIGVWPLISIDSVKYDDTASPVAEQTLVADTDYYADTTTVGGRIETITGWPTVADKPNAVRIRMTAGFEDSAASPIDLADNVPQIIKEGILAYVSFLYEGNCFMETVSRSLLHSRHNRYC